MEQLPSHCLLRMLMELRNHNIMNSLYILVYWCCIHIHFSQLAVFCDFLITPLPNYVQNLLIPFHDFMSL